MPPMMRWLSRLGGTGPSPPPSPTHTVTTPFSPNNVDEQAWTASFASDPSQWERTFEQRWMQAEKFLDKVELDVEHIVTYDEMSRYLRYLSQMCQLLMMEVNAQPEPSIGPILDRFFTQQILDRTLDWAIQVPVSMRPLCQLNLIRIYEGIVSESHTQNHCLLVHKPVLNPLLRLFDWCKKDQQLNKRTRGEPSATDKHFVLLLNQICTKMAEDATLLHFFFTCSDGAEQFMVFSLLVRFLYEQNDVGQLARDALLLILSVSSKNDAVSDFVANKSAFCVVVASGLCGCFSQLGRVLSGDVAERLLPEHSIEPLADFHSSLLFCNAVVQAAHPFVVEKVAQYFYSGFLLNVVKPALLQEEREAAAAATVYLHVCLQTVTEPPLLRTVIRLLLIEKDDEAQTIIQVIVKRINNGDRLSVVSLALIDCLLQRGVEDVLLVLCLRHLLPFRYSSRQRVARVRDRAHAVQVCERLLKCVPECALKFSEIASPLTLQLYLREGASMVDKRAAICSSWKWRYDGVQPSPLLFRNDSDEEQMSGRSPFTRMSSCRSSMSSAAHGLNRYFHSRNAHLTLESVGVLADLGASAPASPCGSDPDAVPIEEDAEFVLPPITTTSMMTSSMMDYFQLVAYDDLSDDPPSSPERAKQRRENPENGESTAVKESTKKQESNEKSGGESSSGGGGPNGFDTDAEMARSFILSGWAQVDDLDTFMSLLERRSIRQSKAASLAENMAFIDSKMQYMRELADEKVDVEPEEVHKESLEEKERHGSDTLLGQPIEDAGGDAGLFLDSLLTQLDLMCTHSLPFNLQLASVLCSLAAFPQPILAAYLFDVETPGRFTQLVQILESLKERLDAFALTVDGIEVWIGRAMRQLNGRAERMERQADCVSRLSESPRDEYSLQRGRLYGGSGRRQQFYRYHSHKVVESREEVLEDERIKNCVHAAVILANLAQQLAAIALHLPVAVVPHFSKN